MTILSPISDGAWQEAEENTKKWSKKTRAERLSAAAFYQAWHNIDADSMHNTALRREALARESAAITKCYWQRLGEARRQAEKAEKLAQSRMPKEMKKPWETWTFWFVVPWSAIFLIIMIASLFGPSEDNTSGGLILLFAAFCATAGTLTLWFVASIAWAGGFLSETVVKAGMKATGYDESSSDTKGS